MISCIKSTCYSLKTYFNVITQEQLLICLTWKHNLMDYRGGWSRPNTSHLLTFSLSPQLSGFIAKEVNKISLCFQRLCDDSPLSLDSTLIIFKSIYSHPPNIKLLQKWRVILQKEKRKKKWGAEKQGSDICWLTYTTHLYTNYKLIYG